MAGNIDMRWAGPQDLVYGFNPKNVVERLTLKNWRRKAVLREDRHGLLYIWMARGKQQEGGKKRVVHVVSVQRPVPVDDRRTNYERYFDDLDDALRYANGEDRSALRRNTRPMGRMILNELGAQLLGDKPAPTTFSVMGMGHQVEIPGPEDEEDLIKPDGYACFLTEVLESVLAVSPGMSKYVYTHGITLHPDVGGRKNYGRNSDLPKRITVLCHKSENKVVARFHVFPKERTTRGLIRAVCIDDSKDKPGGKGRTVVKRASRKSGVKP